jgi:hypothetical protein
MQAHFLGHVESIGFHRLKVFAHRIDDEASGFACVVGYSAEILGGYSNFHVTLQIS